MDPCFHDYNDSYYFQFLTDQFSPVLVLVSMKEQHFSNRSHSVNEEKKNRDEPNSQFHSHNIFHEICHLVHEMRIYRQCHEIGYFPRISVHIVSVANVV